VPASAHPAASRTLASQRRCHAAACSAALRVPSTSDRAVSMTNRLQTATSAESDVSCAAGNSPCSTVSARRSGTAPSCAAEGASSLTSKHVGCAIAAADTGCCA